MSYPTPHDPWHPPQPLPITTPRRAWLPPRLRRLKPKQLAAFVAGTGFLLCCGGLFTIGAVTGSPDAPPDTGAATAAADAARVITASSAAPTPAAPVTTGPSPTPGTADQAVTVPSTPARTTRPKPKPAYYANCDAVRAAGKAPLYRGQPGYRPALDRDDDGVACERESGGSSGGSSGGGSSGGGSSGGGSSGGGSSGGGSSGGGSSGGGSSGGGSTQPPISSGTDPRFSTCKEAKAHGYGPYVQGRDPEYAWYRDADHDGTVCE